jgi:hypothetical protein
VIDATPGDSPSFVCSDLDVATFGGRGRPTTFADAVVGLSFNVLRDDRHGDVLTVTVRH